MSDHDEMIAIADRLSTALMGRDIDEMDALMAPEFSMWHNFSGKTYDREQSMEYLRRFFEQIRGLNYQNIRRMTSSQGFVQQHVALVPPVTDVKDGLSACFVVRVANGQMTQLEEYFDGAQIPQRIVED